MQAVGWLRGNDFRRPEPSAERPPRNFEYPYSNAYEFLLKLGPISNMNNYFTRESPFWDEMFEHPDYDKFWQDRNILPHLRNIKPAVLVVSGWFDAEDLYGTLNSYKEIERTNPGAANSIVMGPWYHCNMNMARDDVMEGIQLNMATASKYFNENIFLPFFNYHLKGKGDFKIPEALMFDTGTLEWREFTEWPSAGTADKSIYLDEAGKLSFSKPIAAGSYSEYISDPAKPVPYRERISADWRYEFMHADQRAFSYRPDVLVFETDVLNEGVTIAGPMTADLFVSTTGTDADWVVKVIDVYPEDMPELDPNPLSIVLDGYQMLVRGDVLRGRYRNSFVHPEPFVPGKVTEVKFEIPDIFHTFKKGHRIMVQIQSSWFPLVDRNPQTFVNIYKAKPEDFQRATHRVFHSKEYPSHLEIKLLNK
jgi:putative CocE/NonD family hydrolase